MFRARRAFLTTAGVLGVVALIFACGPGSIGDLTSGRRDAGTTPVDANVVDASVCEHAVAPPRPTTGDSANVPDLLFAVDNLRFDTSEVDAGIAKPRGLDVDRTCSCLEPPSCVAPVDSGALACDDVNGRDNVVGPLLANVVAIAPALDPSFIRERIRRGVFTVLVSIQKWNGTPNDPDVLVSLRMALHTEAQDPDAVGRPVPKFDGSDVWAVDPGSIIDGDSRIDQDCNEVPCVGLGTDVFGYMNDGVLVGRFADVPLVLNTGSGIITLPFTDATLVARIVDVGGLPRIEGELAGRFPSNKALAISTALEDPSTGKALCTSPGSYAVFKAAICSSTDLALDPNDDHKGKPCNALSAALGFTGFPAKIGHVRAVEVDPSDCPDFADTCAP